MGNKIYYDKYIECPKCRNSALWIETKNPDIQTIICLNCGYYQSGKVEIFLKLDDVNSFRTNIGLKPLERLLELKNYN